VVLDGFCGAGGNAIAFARTCRWVVAIDTDGERLARARANARVYGVADRIEFIQGDFLAVAPRLRALAADVVFLGPPWGGPAYAHAPVFDLATMMQPAGADVVAAARTVTPNIAFLVPRNSDPNQVRATHRQRVRECV
jgi:trimethylguanosine synthase